MFSDEKKFCFICWASDYSKFSSAATSSTFSLALWGAISDDFSAILLNVCCTFHPNGQKLNFFLVQMLHWISAVWGVKTSWSSPQFLELSFAADWKFRQWTSRRTCPRFKPQRKTLSSFFYEEKLSRSWSAIFDSGTWQQ